jgi:hypothetical protein
MTSMDGDDKTSSSEDETGSQGQPEGSEATPSPPNDDESGKPTIDEPTAPALDPGPDEFDKQAENA